MRARSRGTAVLIILILVGIIIGGIIGDLFGEQISFLSKGYSIGIKEPWHIDLNVIQLTFGFMLNINIASVLGLIIAIFVYKRI
ncbi:DUF4321 domain-containing protein [Clostridiisalibacter paucivorans]|uniref:DUF4321 domain-containing protein n=1 Tax=Clostridiisalibacter paucivorans TaxID=408753 RepID=UPI00047A597A|nr:DUF4321 domain-containing protein [Clostridiisalibacter paucivorans]